MSNFSHFLRAHRFEIIACPVLAIEFYIWWRMQQSEHWGNKREPSAGVTSLQFAKNMSNESPIKESDLKKALDSPKS